MVTSSLSRDESLLAVGSREMRKKGASECDHLLPGIPKERGTERNGSIAGRRSRGQRWVGGW